MEPILITGVFRSGTTLAAQMFGAHPGITMVYDSVNFMRFSYGRYDPIEERYRELLQEISERVGKRLGWNLDVDKAAARMTEPTYAEAYNAVMCELNDVKGIWGEKTTLVWTKIPDFFNMFPDGRVVHVIRDPRGVLASWKKFTNAPGNDYLDAIFNCIGSMQHAEEYKERFRDRRYAVLRFEDLLEGEDCLKDVCKKIEIDFSPEMLDSNRFRNKKGEAWKGNSVSGKIEGISKKPIDSWKEALEDWEMFLCQKFCSNLMDGLGYQLQETTGEEQAEAELAKSRLASDGAKFYEQHSRGVERFPSDPLDPKNWSSEDKIGVS